MRVLLSRSFCIVTCLSILVGCANSGAPVASLVAPNTANTATTSGTLGASGTTLQITGPFGTSATITIAPVTVGAGNPVVATLIIPQDMMAALARGRFDTVTPQNVSVVVRVSGTVMTGHMTGTSEKFPYDTMDVQLRLAENQASRFSNNEDARVTDSEGYSACGASIDAAHIPPTPDHGGADLQVDNGINITNPNSTDATIDASFVIDTASGTAARRRQDDSDTSCSASTSTLDTTTSPEPTVSPNGSPSPVPTVTAAPTASPSAAPTASASAAPTASASAAPTASPTAAPTTNACPYAGTFSGPLTDGRFSPPLVTTFTQVVTCSPPNGINVSWSDPSYGTGGYRGTSSGLTVTLANGQVINQYSADYNSIVLTESNSSQEAMLTRTGP